MGCGRTKYAFLGIATDVDDWGGGEGFKTLCMLFSTLLQKAAPKCRIMYQPDVRRPDLCDGLALRRAALGAGGHWTLFWLDSSSRPEERCRRLSVQSANRAWPRRRRNRRPGSAASKPERASAPPILPTTYLYVLGIQPTTARTWHPESSNQPEPRGWHESGTYLHPKYMCGLPGPLGNTHRKPLAFLLSLVFITVQLRCWVAAGVLAAT